jgi:hypothetical protein
VDALENVAKIYGTQKITKVVHGHLQEDEDLQEEVTIIHPLLDVTFSGLNSIQKGPL